MKPNPKICIGCVDLMKKKSTTNNDMLKEMDDRLKKSECILIGLMPCGGNYAYWSDAKKDEVPSHCPFMTEQVVSQ